MWLLSGNPLVAAISLILPTFGYMIIKRWSVKVLDLVDQLSPFRGRYSALRVLEHPRTGSCTGRVIGLNGQNGWSEQRGTFFRRNPVSFWFGMREMVPFWSWPVKTFLPTKKRFFPFQSKAPWPTRPVRGEILLKEMIEREPASDSLRAPGGIIIFGCDGDCSHFVRKPGLCFVMPGSKDWPRHVQRNRFGRSSWIGQIGPIGLERSFKRIPGGPHGGRLGSRPFESVGP
jgi:hypothetical protein